MSEILKSEDMGGVILERQVTVQMSSEQYERLFFQPSAPRGDFAKRLGTLDSSLARAVELSVGSLTYLYDMWQVTQH
jgi:hypothetical protein